MIYSPPILQPDWSEVTSHGTTIVVNVHQVILYTYKTNVHVVTDRN